jgi:DNA-binding CsgD family transcriptional regulator
VLIHLLHGKSREEIAQLLHISAETVKSHIRCIYRHFKVDSQVQLMRWFHAGGASEANAAEDAAHYSRCCESSSP